MARTDNLTNFLTDVADAIREKTGSSDPIQASSFDTAIEGIPSGGGFPPDWRQIGYSSTPDYITNAFNYAKNIYDNWDSSRTSMENLYQGVQELNFMPLVDTSNVTFMGNVFSECARLVYVPQFDTSKVTNMNGMLSYCGSIKSVPQFDTSKVTNMGNMFSNDQNLNTVALLDCGAVTDISNMFSGCTRLINMSGLKDLGKAYQTSRSENYSAYILNLSSCNNLTHDSLMNVINNLYDIKTKGCRNQKLQLGSTNLAKLTAEEIAIATNKGWNVT